MRSVHSSTNRAPTLCAPTGLLPDSKLPRRGTPRHATQHPCCHSEATPDIFTPSFRSNDKPSLRFLQRSQTSILDTLSYRTLPPSTTATQEADTRETCIRIWEVATSLTGTLCGRVDTTISHHSLIRAVVHLSPWLSACMFVGSSSRIRDSVRECSQN